MTCPPRISFEFFPPGQEREPDFFAAASRLAQLDPSFLSVTYGAGGSQRARSDAIVRSLAAQGLPIAAHITCVGESRQDIADLALGWWKAGITRLIALRGDAATPADGFCAQPEGFANSIDLITGLQVVAPFDISVAAYPEMHPEARSVADDLDFLKRKFDAGATRAITQYFFAPEVFLRFRDRARRAGITQDLIPGILPVHDFAKVQAFSLRCGASIPDWLGARFSGLDQDPETQSLVAASTAAELCLALQKEGVEAFHFYTLNHAKLSFAVSHLLGLRSGLKEAA